MLPSTLTTRSNADICRTPVVGRLEAICLVRWVLLVEAASQAGLRVVRVSECLLDQASWVDELEMGSPVVRMPRLC